MAKKQWSSAPRKVDKSKFILSLVAVFTIVSIMSYQISQKIAEGTTEDIWQEWLLIGVVVALFIRILFVYIREEKQNKSH